MKINIWREAYRSAGTSKATPVIVRASCGLLALSAIATTNTPFEAIMWKGMSFGLE